MLVSPTIQHPHGRVRSITGTDPAVNTEISETVPERRRWRILAIRFTLVTDEIEANRVVHLIIDDGANIFLDVCVTTAHAASTTKTYNFSNFGSTQLEPADCLYIPLPPLPLSPGFRIRTATDLLKANDNFSAPQLLVEEWIDP